MRALLLIFTLFWAWSALAQTPPQLGQSKYFPEKTEFPLLTGPNLRDGKPWSLAEQKGKVVAIMIWSIDCRYCFEEMPELQSFWDKHRAKGFELVGLSVDDASWEIRDFLGRYPKLKFPVLWRLQEGVEDGFARAKGTPTTYVIDRQGKIVFKRFGQLRDEHLVWLEHLIEGKS